MSVDVNDIIENIIDELQSQASDGLVTIKDVKATIKNYMPLKLTQPTIGNMKLKRIVPISEIPFADKQSDTMLADINQPKFKLGQEVRYIGKYKDDWDGSRIFICEIKQKKPRSSEDQPWYEYTVRDEGRWDRLTDGFFEDDLEAVTETSKYED